MDNNKRPLGPVSKQSEMSDDKPTMPNDYPVLSSTKNAPVAQTKSHKVFWVLLVVMLLALAAAGVSLRLYVSERDKNLTLEKQNRELLVEQGVSETEEEASTQGSGTDADTETPLSDDDQIMAAAREFVCVLAETDCENISLQRLGGTWEGETAGVQFAQVTFGNGEFGGGGMVLKNTGDDWVVVTAGQSISEEIRALYRIPEMTVDES